ncbi:type II toxin-antitoxin system VapC family toxin [Nitrospina watsonii]|uniref:Ribonuclease VapC n=1 Tax=Nitrospina watsonii TaxID=1323948 RepID=A0ABM9H9T9_9BACT|nr:PIN domain nuclease [Nitrospina watsonii]CAI2716873.1 Ribonuclease VapC [Nitrospina watsonii]
MILVDTSVWVDFLKGADSRERRALRRLIEEEADLALTGIILTETLQGIREDKDFNKVKESLLAFPLCQPKDFETYLKAAQIYRDCRKQGKTVRKTVDCLIAAICLEHDLILFHKDRNFDHIADCTELKVL